MDAGVEIVVAFLGGLLALLSPCSALLLPAFFAYAFPSHGRLLLRTAIFYAGLVTVLVPVGLGLGALGALVLEQRAALSVIAGLLLIAIGVHQVLAGGFELPGAGRLPGRASGESVSATYALGAVYGVAGFCAGPILGGVLTIAAASGGALAGGGLLAVYALGMAAPLFGLAAAWNRIGPGPRARLRGRELRIGPFVRHSSIVASSAMFVALGIAFIAFQGSSALSGLYASVGAADLSLALETTIGDAARGHPLIASAAVVLGLATAVAVVARRRHRGLRP